MDLTIVAVYTICDDLLISLGHREHPQTQITDADCNYAIEDALGDIGITFKPLRKKNAKRQYPPHEVYLQHHYRKRVEVTNSLVEKLLPKSIQVSVTSTGFELKLFLFLIATNIKMRFED